MIQRPGMELILQPNGWSCNPASFAMCMGLSFDEVIAALGHDGSKIVNFDATDPLDAIEGFDARELVLMAYRLGFAAIEFPLRIKSVDPQYELNPHWPEDFWSVFPKDQRFVIVLRTEREKESYHCVAWQRDKSYYLDPLIGKVNLPFELPTQFAIAITRIQQ